MNRDEALAAYDRDNPPSRTVELRRVVLLEMEPGQWWALAPWVVEWAEAWNAEARAKWLKENPDQR
jgi:hypothetical protein